MVRIAIAGIGFMGMMRRRIHPSARKPSDFRKISVAANYSLCL
jgi:hypothetical protein